MRKPFTGTILGIVLGFAVAIVLQQNGTWPLDRLTVWFLPAMLGFLVMWLLSIGKEGSMSTFVLSLVILVPMAVWGALGLGDTNASGFLNGGCTVAAQSSIDAVNSPSETSKSDPFRIDPNGSLSWQATSPTVFDDYPWEIAVEIGGISVPVAGSENENNDAGKQDSSGETDNVTAFARSEGIDIDQIRGVFSVSGFAASCDGVAYLELVDDPFSTLASQVAAAVIIVIIIFIIVIMILSRGGKAAVAAAAAGSAAVTQVDGDPSGGAPGPGTNEPLPGDIDGDGDVDLDDFTAMPDSGVAGDVDGDGEPDPV